MTAKPLSLQDVFLNSARRSKAPLTVFLLKGVKLQGVITWFDAFSLLLRREGQAQLIYKHAISTIMPSKSLELNGAGQSEGAGKTSLQDSFLSAAAREHQHMTVFLVNGVMLQGSVTAHDQFSLLLERSGQAQLVYKHAVSTIQPEHPLALGEPADDQAAK
jgi:host factor-I protein